VYTRCLKKTCKHSHKYILHHIVRDICIVCLDGVALRWCLWDKGGKFELAGGVVGRGGSMEVLGGFDDFWVFRCAGIAMAF